MKIYTVQRMEKYDYDFSVILKKCGCFTDKEKAKEAARREYKKLYSDCAEEIERYSNEDEYRDVDEGMFEAIEDDENGYYRISFGYGEDYEMHNVAVNEWELEE